MSTLNFNSDVTAKVATTLTRMPDSHAYIVKAEHTDATPSTILLRRKLAGAKGSVKRTYGTRTRYVTVFAGTELEAIVPIVTKVENSIPVGVAISDVNEVRDDMIGLMLSSEFDELNEFGVVSGD